MYNVIRPERPVEQVPSATMAGVALNGAAWGLLVESGAEEAGHRETLTEWLRELADAIESGRMLP